MAVPLRTALARGRPWPPSDGGRGHVPAPRPFAPPGVLRYDVELPPVRGDRDGDGSGVPMTVLKRADAERAPMVVFLHATGSSTEDVLPQAARYAADGFVAVGVDARHHGRRRGEGEGRDTRARYGDALLRAWRAKQEGREHAAPFLIDSAYDVCRAVRYFADDPEPWGIDASRIGITGISLGGMIGLLAAAADETLAVAAPMIGTQSFAWGLENDSWQARAASLPGPVFEEARRARGTQGALTPDDARAVYGAIAPGLLEHGDGECTIPLVLPRPLAIINASDDPRNPLGGVRTALAAARASSDASALFAVGQERTAHECTPAMEALAHAFLKRHLRGGAAPVAVPDGFAAL